FADMPRARTGELEESCGPLGRLWLESRYEGSPLAPLKPFSVDPATLGLLKTDLAAFRTAEVVRERVLRTVTSTFELSDAAPLRAWLDEHGHRFETMPLDQRANLARWFAEFARDSTRSSRGAQALVTLNTAITALRNLHATGLDITLLSKVAHVSLRDVDSWSLLAPQATATLSFFPR